jgi:hypothetical protein
VIPGRSVHSERETFGLTTLQLIARGRDVLVPAVVRVALCPPHCMAMHRNVSHWTAVLT